jgi:hypothetical protein
MTMHDLINSISHLSIWTVAIFLLVIYVAWMWLNRKGRTS